jgi:hypothetical protein
VAVGTAERPLPTLQRLRLFRCNGIVDGNALSPAIAIDLALLLGLQNGF